jgi:hypothetical protein
MVRTTVKDKQLMVKDSLLRLVLVQQLLHHLRLQMDMGRLHRRRHLLLRLADTAPYVHHIFDALGTLT